jgi:carbamoyl-phosphate synthase large subunit
MAKSVRVAVTGFGGLDNPEPGIGVARALRRGWRGGLDIEALVYDPWATGGWAPAVADRLHTITPLAHGDHAVLHRLVAVHRAYRLDAFIPCLDLEISVMSRLERRLSRAGIRTLLPESEDIAAVSKVNLSAFCYASDVATPRTIHVREIADVALHVERFGYPLWVKGTVAGAKKVDNRDKAVHEAVVLNAKWGGGVLLQELVEGDEYVVAMVARANGSCLAMVPMRKLGRNERGKGVIGAVIEDPELKRVSLRLLEKLHWRGPLELEFVRSTSSGRFFLIEINCRFPSWILLSDFAGCNLPVALLKEILAPSSRNPRLPRAGAAYARDVHEFAVPVEGLMRLQRFGEVPVPAPSVRASARGDLAVGITGISAFELTQPGLGVAQCLRTAPEAGRLIGLAYTPNDTGLYRRDLFDFCCRIPVGGNGSSDSTDDAPLLDRLLEIKRKRGLDLVIPCLDFEIEPFRRIAPELARIGIRTLLPSPAAQRMLSKKVLFNPHGRRDWGGFELPETMIVRTQRDLDRAWRRFGAPLALKGPVHGSSTVYTLDQARVEWQNMRRSSGSFALAQSIVSGEEFGVGLVCDRGHRMVSVLSVKKLLKCERGKTWGAIPLLLPELTESLAALLAHIRWTGPADAELIRDGVRERFVLIEVNPRFPAWIGFSGMVGPNLPRQLLLAAFDRSAEPASPENGLARDMLFMRTSEELPVQTTTMAFFAGRGEVHHA